MAHVDLCSGIGGFALGFEWAGLSKPVLFCDIEPWSRKILAKHWPDVPIAEDVKELANDPDGLIHAIGDRRSILSCGYPCQPFSQAGQRRGIEDDRHIWPEIFSIIQQVRPDWIVCENVSGHITMGLDEVLSDLADKANYAVQTFHLGAVSVDAPHRRMRLWIIGRNVANTDSEQRWNRRVSGNFNKQEWQSTETERKSLQPKNRKAHASYSKQSSEAVADTISARGEAWASDTVGDGDKSRSNKKQPKSSGCKADVADTDSKRLQGVRANDHSKRRKKQNERQIRLCSGAKTKRSIWKPESPVCGMADGLSRWVDEPGDIPRVSQGVPDRVQRLKGLGNAIVPQIAMRIGQIIRRLEAGDE